MFKKYQRIVDLLWQLERKGLYGEEMQELKMEIDKLQAEIDSELRAMGLAES